jgi:hypothetical protein
MFMKKIIISIISLVTIMSLLCVGCVSRKSLSSANDETSDVVENITTIDNTENNPTIIEINLADETVSYITEFEDGGRDYVYIIDDIEHHCLVPPEGFSPLTATDEELARYCFPPRPTDEAQLKQWENQMKYYKSTPAPSVDDTVEIRYPDKD